MSLQAALELATKAHADQWREGDMPLPYSTHVIEVLLNLRHIGHVTDTEMLCAAVLHDTVECGVLNLPGVEKAFGKRVGGLVAELTRTEPSLAQTMHLSKDEVWQLRSDMLVDEVREMSADAQQVKLADRLANLHEAKRTKKGRKLSRYLLQTRKILDAVPRARNRALWDAIADELREP